MSCYWSSWLVSVGVAGLLIISNNSCRWIWQNEVNTDAFEKIVSEMESILGINSLHFCDYSDPYESSILLLSNNRDIVPSVWNPVINSKLDDLRAWSTDHQAFTRPHLRGTVGGWHVCVKQFAAGDTAIVDEVARLWRVRGSSHVLKFHGIIVKERDTYLVFDKPQYTLEEFWRVDANCAWQIKMKHIRDLVGAVAFLHSLGLSLLGFNFIGIVHRNLNSNTVMIDTFNNVKIAGLTLSNLTI